ncbi:MAG: hypothetical protein VX252_00735 [Myxococcota bacterium]|nr:hypothetical protein [Myxococcota bacterium]
MKSTGPLTPEADLVACSTWRVFFSSLMQKTTARLGRQSNPEEVTPTFWEWWGVHLLHRIPAPLLDRVERMRSRRNHP